MAHLNDINILTDLFVETFQSQPEVSPLNGGGSNRRYYRLKDKLKSVIGVVGEDLFENEVFLRLDKVLEKSSIKVPKILKVSSDKRGYLLQDLGDQSLFDLLNGNDKIELAQEALDKLIEIQSLPSEIWADKVGYAPFSERLIRWDLNYFKYDYLKPVGVEFDEEKLENDFDKLVSVLSNDNIITGLMYRDFQSRNIMVKDGELWFIDFQGSRMGPLVYDAVSFIWQAKAPFSYEERIKLAEYYSEKLALKIGEKRSDILIQLNSMIVLRALQVLGAYGFRGLIEKKAHFLESIPYAISNLNYLSYHGYLDQYHEINNIAKKLNLKEVINDKSGLLTVSVYSFSYKKGYPDDYSGNGGGFVFDCRGITNPGRFEKYKSQTGLDKEVIDFIESNDEAKEFLKNSINVVSPSIDRYLKRNFTSLHIGFGCTGGRHRSVYCAEHFGEKIKKLYPEVKVYICHREQGIDKYL